MTVTLALDTCVIPDVDFLTWAKAESNIDLVISPIVYMERRRQLLNRHGNATALDQLIKHSRINVTQFDKNIAGLAAELMNKQPKSCPECKKLDWADVMILACVERPQALLVTNNKNDFLGYGMDGRILTPDEAVQRFSAWSDPDLRMRQT